MRGRLTGFGILGEVKGDELDARICYGRLEGTTGGCDDGCPFVFLGVLGQIFQNCGAADAVGTGDECCFAHGE